MIDHTGANENGRIRPAKKAWVAPYVILPEDVRDCVTKTCPVACIGESHGGTKGGATSTYHGTS